jgi:hypothetical protein
VKPEQAKDEWHVATGALDPDCSHSGKNPDGGFQFMVPCPASSTSPDGKWKLVIGKEGPAEGSGASVTLQRADGSHLASVSELTDAMPFVLYWLPRPNWFLVSHHVGSFMDRPEVYEIGPNRVILHDLTRAAAREAKRISPCLRNVKWDFVHGNPHGWSSDGKKIAWGFTTRTDACMSADEYGPVSKEDQWKPFWMISDAETGEIIPGSVRVHEGDGRAQFPSDGMYSGFQRISG